MGLGGVPDSAVEALFRLAPSPHARTDPTSGSLNIGFCLSELPGFQHNDGKFLGLIFSVAIAIRPFGVLLAADAGSILVRGGASASISLHRGPGRDTACRIAGAEPRFQLVLLSLQAAWNVCGTE